MVDHIYKVKLDTEEYITKVVSVYSALYISKNLWLTNKEMSFYIAFIMNTQKKLEIVSEESLENYKRLVGIERTNDVYTYFSKICKKRWAIKKDKEYILPKMFENLQKEFNFDISIANKDEDNR